MFPFFFKIPFTRNAIVAPKFGDIMIDGVDGVKDLTTKNFKERF